jgi:hypothetical protein
MKKSPHIWMVLFYSASTAYFLYQHTTGISWDFSVYVMNAKHFLGQGIYFEWYRPPLAPVLFILLSFMGWKLAEYAYIVLVSALFAFSAYALAKRAKVPAWALYGLSLTPFTLNNSFLCGTEMLYTALLSLFIAYMGKRRSAFFLSLSILTRYTGLIYLALLVFKKGLKEIAIALAILGLCVSPWLAYNYYTSGDPLMSYTEAYSLNMKFRDEYMPAISISPQDVYSVLGLYAPLALIGLAIKWRKGIDTFDKIMLLLAALTIISYARIPAKEARYMFTLIIPAAYYTLILVQSIAKKKTPLLVCALVALNFLTAYATFLPLRNPEAFINVIPYLDGCALRSNAWPYFNYLGIPCEPYPPWGSVYKEIENGKRILLYKHDGPEPDYINDKRFLDDLPKIRETEDYILVGDKNKCAPPKNVTLCYRDILREIEDSA